MQTLIPVGSRLWAWAQESIASAPDCAERFDEKDRPKALVHTYLASQKQPGTPMGLGIRKLYFDAQAELAIRFVSWVRSTFC